jgi:tRNA (guanine-N7-)-methyltransferase
MARHRPHVNPLKLNFLARRPARLELPPDREVEVELGCAEAQFLFERSARRPDVVPVGLEIRRELCDEVNDRSRREGSAVRAVFCHANVELPELFPAASVTRFFVNFPDPWFKKRHHKRRVVDPALASSMAQALRPGGELFFQTDVWELALDALAVFEDEPRLRNQDAPWSFWKRGNPYGVRSRRETGCEEEGLPIWRALYRRLPDRELE